MTSSYGPEFGRFYPLIVKALREAGGSGSTSKMLARSVELLDLTAEEREAELASGSLRYQPGFALGWLSEGGILDCSIRGVVRLTKLGNSLNLESFNWLNFSRLVQKSISDKHERRKEVEAKTGRYAEEALAILRELPASGFERLCQSLLRRCGFRQVTVTGQTEYGGIEGVGILNVGPFVSLSVMFQCDQYPRTFNKAELQDFRSGIIGRAEKGFLLTTGTLAKEAQEEARRDGAPPIELVDGESLVRLFESLEFGLVERKTYDVDVAFFHQFQE